MYVVVGRQHSEAQRARLREEEPLVEALRARPIPDQGGLTDAPSELPTWCPTRKEQQAMLHEQAQMSVATSKMQRTPGMPSRVTTGIGTPRHPRTAVTTTSPQLPSRARNSWRAQGKSATGKRPI